MSDRASLARKLEQLGSGNMLVLATCSMDIRGIGGPSVARPRIVAHRHPVAFGVPRIRRELGPRLYRVSSVGQASFDFLVLSQRRFERHQKDTGTRGVAWIAGPSVVLHHQQDALHLEPNRSKRAVLVVVAGTFFEAEDVTVEGGDSFHVARPQCQMVNLHRTCANRNQRAGPHRRCGMPGPGGQSAIFRRAQEPSANILVSMTVVSQAPHPSVHSEPLTPPLGPQNQNPVSRFTRERWGHNAEFSRKTTANRRQRNESCKEWVRRLSEGKQTGLFHPERFKR